MTGFARARALIIGVATYLHVRPSLPDVVRKDAQDVAAALVDQDVAAYDPTAVTILVDAAASALAIQAELGRAAAQTSADDLFLFYFSGHGHRVRAGNDERSYLLPHDASLANLDATALSDADLHTLLSGIKAERKVVILDACHSGGMGRLKSSESQVSGFGKSGVDSLAQGRGRAVFSSSRADEVSLVLPGMSNSLFTAAILEALQGAAPDRGDGTIGVFDLFSYVSEVVPRQAAQHPVFKSDDLESNFAIARRGSRKSVAAPSSHAKKPLADQVEGLFATLYPLGPTHDEIWSRAGGDLSRVSLRGHGVAQWHAAIDLIQKGGGTTLSKLLAAAADDFPENATLAALRSSI